MKAIEHYLRHVESICGGEGKFFRITDEGESPVTAVVSYENIPESGCLTAFSYGLSSIDHVEWKNSRPELVISVESVDHAWAIAMGEMIKKGRDKHLFSYGDILKFGQKVVDESEITAFLVFACTALEEADQSVTLPDRKIQFSQLYPIYEQEIELIKQVGPEHFVFEMGIDFYDPRRPAVT